MAKFTDGNILDRLDDLEAPPLVKIYTKIISRKYKRRYPYAYPKHLVPVSACYNELIVDFLKEKRLEERIYILGETMLLALTRRKGEAPQNGNK
jgi:hypothetical protein